MSTAPVLVAGEALIDIVRPPDAEALEHVGGSPANVAIGLARLSHPTVLATWVGQDERGRRIVSHLQERGVPLVEGSTAGARTSTALASLDADGVAVYDFDLDWQLPPTDLGSAAHLHTGSLAATVEPGGTAVLELMTAAHGRMTVSYDPNLRPSIMGEPHEVRARIEECVGCSDVVKASSEDLDWLYAGAPPADVAHLWGLLGPALVVVTRGGQGALVHLSGTDRQFEVPAVPVTVVDTVGAGDSFMAGLLSGLLDGGLVGAADSRSRLRSSGEQDLVDPVRRAVACATYTVERAGAAAPTRSDLTATR